ncbi:MAG: hypothetical protein IKJ27_12115 [Clostridia bacterium]|nr:hypothetical protein [Clostridia bacterium]
MEEFLVGIEKYELLIELFFTLFSLIIALVSLGLSGYVIWQTNKLAKRQAKQEREIAEQQNELQKRQIRLELFDRKLQINNALNQTFRLAQRIKTFYDHSDFEKYDCKKMSEYFELCAREVNEDDVYNCLRQAEFIISDDKYKQIERINVYFRLLLVKIWLIKDNIYKNEHFGQYEKELLQDIVGFCDEILEHFESVEQFMTEELNIVRIDK